MVRPQPKAWLINAAGGEVVSRASPVEAVVGGDDERPDLVAVIKV